MHVATETKESWPALDWAQWRETAVTLQLWTQIAGKIRLALTPWLNHSWQVPLYVSARGLSTSAIPANGGLLDLEFDFLAHRLWLRTSSGGEEAVALEPRAVAAFYDEVMGRLNRLGITVRIDRLPNEVNDPVPFDRDRRHHSYDADAAHRFWRALIGVDRLLKRFRTGFLGKASPVHFFWGSFDLAVTRFSGRPAPLHPGGVPALPDRVVREAYSHEVSSAGFWPGNDAYPRAAFYSYAYPEPPGFGTAQIPSPAHYEEALGEYLLDYDDLRRSADPDALVLDFLQSTYAAAADNARWDRESLDCPLGEPGVPRPVDQAAAGIAASA